MRTHSILLLALAAAALAAFTPGDAEGQERAATPAPTPAPSATPQPSPGMLGTMPHGTYECALPGDAGGAAFVVVPEEGFRIGAASSYANAEGSGIYLLRGKDLVFTRGPKKDERYRRLGDNTLQKRGPDGFLTKLICTRLGSGG